MSPQHPQYDEFDNAALTMIAHSPTAWDHVHFKDVLVKVSNVEVYYKAISFYLAEHPDLLVDMLKVGTCDDLVSSSVPVPSASPHMLHPCRSL